MKRISQFIIRIASCFLSWILLAGIFSNGVYLHAKDAAKNSDALYKEGRKLAAHSPRAAYHKFTRALESSSPEWKKRSECLLERGILLFKEEQYYPALSDLSQVIKLRPKHFLAHKTITKILFVLKKYDQAIQESEVALELNDRDPEIHYLRGRVFLMMYQIGGNSLQGNIIASAVREFDDAIKGKRKYLDAYFHRAIAYMVSGNFKEAIQDFEKVLKINDRVYQAWYEMAKAYQKQMNELKTVEALEACLKIKESFLPAYQMLLPVCEKLRFKDKIQFYLDKAVKLFPQDPLIWSYIKRYPPPPKPAVVQESMKTPSPPPKPKEPVKKAPPPKPEKPEFVDSNYWY
ncbi:MAG: tetratricopeptide repeat protein [Candidatus Aureabacteria bacterium]|nr:tetratricopeptide repeat protein [Candidatus Auribacterota bacterium]